MKTMSRSVIIFVLIGFFGLTVSCASGGGGSVSGNETGSEPINDKEALEYKKAVVRCYKTGGTRVVKIMGELRCY
jgi:hypothetical protein